MVTNGSDDQTEKINVSPSGYLLESLQLCQVKNRIKGLITNLNFCFSILVSKIVGFKVCDCCCWALLFMQSLVDHSHSSIFKNNKILLNEMTVHDMKY